MDDKLVWTDTVSTFALHGVSMPEVLQRMWGHLRAAVLYFMRYQANQHQCEHIDAAQDHLLKYGRLVQRTWNMQELMTFNLHTRFGRRHIWAKTVSHSDVIHVSVTSDS
jgi:hypothetical protein